MDSPIYLSILGYLAVLGTLATLYAAFLAVGRLHKFWLAKRRPKAVAAATTEAVTIAAIAAAVALYLDEEHDAEAGIVTIERAARLYSPWSSKYQNFTPTPNRKR
jgi:hypothetical protein